MDLLRPTFVQVHLDRLIENFRALKALNPGGSFICPMIKANAYGHGDIAVAKALVKENCKHLGVSSVEEGCVLRLHNISQEILVFGFQGQSATEALLAHNLTPVISDFSQLSLIAEEARRETKVHLKFDSGMHRLGFQGRQIESLKNLLQKSPQLKVTGLCTHLHSGSDLEPTHRQLQEFSRFCSQFPKEIPFVHVYNSAAFTTLYQKKEALPYGFRPGLLVYGIDPHENLSLKPLVSPVMEFKSKIVSIQQVKSGEVVSYGGTWRAAKDSLIGIIPAGYADGVCRSLSNKGEFLVLGQKVPIRGRVCMDYTMVDLTGLEHTTGQLLNQEVVLIGQQAQGQITVEDYAKSAGRITYEVMTGISSRVPRIYGAIR